MPGAVPPTIERPTTVIGIGMREVLILGGGLLLACLAILSPLGLIPRVGAAVLAFGSSALLALGRAPASGKTAEAFILDVIRFRTRDRLLQRNTDPAPRPAPSTPPHPADNPPRAPSRLRIEALPLDASGLLGLLSLTFLLMLLVWIWTGGLAELLLRYSAAPLQQPPRGGWL